MSTFILLASRGLETHALFTTDDADAAMHALGALALLAPDLRLTLYASGLGEGSRRVLVVDAGHWALEGASAWQEAA